MHRTNVLMIALFVPFIAASWAAADATVTVEKTHLCCGSCVKGATKAITSVAGAKAECSTKTGSITITAPDAEAAQKAVDALAEAGYYGKTTGATIKDDSGAPAGNVKSLSVSGIHNCCRKCTIAINNVIKKVPGATCEVAAKAETFTVTGDFDAATLVKEFNEAGFHVKVSAK